ncbi:MAG: protein tyrosine phosphatase family protein, partial [Acidiferrobacterales bacterium]|nr:protein tyrosine phosphatase family protein [Acidiferrobacterales bacterium]
RLPFGLYTSGQPTAGQFESIKQAGVETVINLAPANAENALANEAELWADMGMHYQHMPVDFSNPTEQDFARFCALLESQQLNRIWLHCAANMRVSAFVFRYRCEILGHERKDAERDLNKIWQPIGVWKKFVAVNK